MDNHKKEKEQLIKSGTYEKYLNQVKEVYRNGQTPTEDPKAYDLTEEEMRLIKQIQLSKKRKVSEMRRHVFFMSEYYDNLGFLTLGYSDQTRDNSTLETKKHTIAKILSKLFCDYVGRFEISKNGKIHFHCFVAWNGEVDKTRYILNNGKSETQVIHKELEQLWYGQGYIDESNGKKYGDKYGIYHLVLVEKTENDQNKLNNYMTKSFNTMTTYVNKAETITDVEVVSDELIYAVNTSNTLTARNTPYQRFRKDQDKQDNELKKICRAFDTEFYEKHKFDTFNVFRQWAEDNKTTNISLNPNYHIDLLGKDFKVVSVSDY